MRPLIAGPPSGLVGYSFGLRFLALDERLFWLAWNVSPQVELCYYYCEAV
jgi:hypothetical protein